MAIGDINSSEKGSGARYNDDKPDISLIPLTVLSDIYNAATYPTLTKLVEAMAELGKFQGGDDSALFRVCGLIEFDYRSCARVFSYGKQKYAAWNWAKGMSWNAVIACAGRHLAAMIEGDDSDLDPESGLPHKGHLECNLVMLLHYLDHYPEGDDRPKEWL